MLYLLERRCPGKKRNVDRELNRDRFQQAASIQTKEIYERNGCVWTEEKNRNQILTHGLLVQKESSPCFQHTPWAAQLPSFQPKK